MATVLRHEDYTIAWIAILQVEVEAAIAALDRRHRGHFESVRGDDYTYIGGEINGHNVVIAKLPAGQNYGVGSAAALVNQVKARFSNIWFALLVGVAVGLPKLTKDKERRRDIRLGDVLVCVPDKSSTGIIHYDLGTDTEAKFETTGRQAEPPALVRSAIGTIQLLKRPFKVGNELADLLECFQKAIDDDSFQYPGQDQDQLFEYQDNEGNPLLEESLAKRELRNDDERTRVWYGRIGSGSTLMRNARRRDQLRDEYDLIGLEMEAAGVMNAMPTGVIRGVCDYGDRYKTKKWQPYAAAVAAVYAKALLFEIRPKAVTAQLAELSSKALMAKYHRGLNLLGAPDLNEMFFTGRGTELDQIRDVLKSDIDKPDRKTIVLGALGGIGKTQLAICYAKQNREEHSSIFWLNATSELTLKNSFHEIPRCLAWDGTEKVTGQNDIDQERARVLAWFSEPENSRWLLVFDNYDDPNEYKIEQYFPYRSHGSILVTSRRPDYFEGRFKCLSLQPFDKLEDSLRVLETRSQRAGVMDNKHAHALAKRLDGLPLALATVGADLRKHPRLSFEQYLKEYDSRWNLNPRRPVQLHEYSDRQQDRTLYTTWDISYSRLQEDDASAARLLKLLAYFDHQQIWFELLQKGVNEHTPLELEDIVHDSTSFENTMTVLVEYCFVEVQLIDEEQPLYSLHTCVHDWSLASLNATSNMNMYLFAFRSITSSIEVVEWAILGQVYYTKYAAHARRLTHGRFEAAMKKTIEQFTSRAQFMAQLLHQQIQFAAAERVFLHVLHAEEKALGSDHKSTLDTVHSLGSLYHDQGKLEEAEQMYERALAGGQKALGPDHTSTLSTVHNLGSLYCDQGKLEEAEQMYERALAGTEKALGPDHTSTLSMVHNLGSLYCDQGKLEEAERMYRRALAGTEKALGPDHTLTLSTVHSLGSLYRDQGKLEEAERMYLQALAGIEKTLGPDHTLTLTTVHNLGAIYRDQGKLEEAERMYRRALTGRERLLRNGHPDTLLITWCLASLYASEKAELSTPLFQRAVAGFEKALGHDHPRTRSCREEYSRLVQKT